MKAKFRPDCETGIAKLVGSEEVGDVCAVATREVNGEYIQILQVLFYVYGGEVTAPITDFIVEGEFGAPTE